MPLSIVADDLSKDDWSLLKDFTVPALAFHNDNDPTALYDVAKEKIAMFASSISIETLSGDNHDYLTFTDYEPRINSFLKTSFDSV
jgi:hypothetical protein